jgi:hypothetical protein
MKLPLLFQIGLSALVLSGVRGETTSPSSNASSLSPIAFLTAHEWDPILPTAKK